MGDFKCEGSNECNVVYVGMDSDTGDFTYDFGTNADVLNALGIKPTVNRKSVTNKWREVNRPESEDDSGRKLQTTADKKLRNPVVCIKENTNIFFQVDSKTRNFPQYFKDSILNTNEEFDYGAFTELADVILNQNQTVTSFSYNF